MELIHKVENGELNMLGYVMLNPELKEPFSDYARGNGITCPTAADAVRFLKEYEERLYQELLPWTGRYWKDMRNWWFYVEVNIKSLMLPICLCQFLSYLFDN